MKIKIVFINYQRVFTQFSQKNIIIYNVEKNTRQTAKNFPISDKWKLFYYVMTAFTPSLIYIA